MSSLCLSNSMRTLSIHLFYEYAVFFVSSSYSNDLQHFPGFSILQHWQHLSLTGDSYLTSAVFLSTTLSLLVDFFTVAAAALIIEPVLASL